MYYLTLQVFPLSYWSYVIQLFLLVFIPISGRRGATTNPDVLVGCLVSFLFCVLIQFLTPVLVKIEKRISYRIITFLVRGIFILQSFTTDFLLYRFTSVNHTQKHVFLRSCHISLRWFAYSPTIRSDFLIMKIQLPQNKNDW